ncbi:hypothetical protein DUNSADRAFT_4714 [Dunaliella salina]|uniref:Encoded protein n=1 Tax=Dunaliella salina TaxID=3046 RepID=A0ABQ7H7J3_DUNSA|nr:hypothetical protein DUNSADRAFT_4714 [Dunaliella salina]|eukprot:KAF5842830.1 hypothetical protein DUNSADRAFT_4714 [Dunaliella salina]
MQEGTTESFKVAEHLCQVTCFSAASQACSRVLCAHTVLCARMEICFLKLRLSGAVNALLASENVHVHMCKYKLWTISCWLSCLSQEALKLIEDTLH